MKKLFLSILCTLTQSQLYTPLHASDEENTLEHKKQPSHLAFNLSYKMPSDITAHLWHTEQQYLFGRANGTVGRKNLATKAITVSPQRHRKAVHALASLSTARYASGANDATIMIWDIATPKPVQTYSTAKRAIASLAVHNNMLAAGLGEPYLLKDDSDNHAGVYLWDLNSKPPRPCKRYKVEECSSIPVLVWCDEHTLIAGTNTGTVIYFDRRQETYVQKISISDAAITSIIYNPTTKIAATIATKNNHSFIGSWHTEEPKDPQKWPLQQQPDTYYLAATPHSYIAVGLKEQTCSIEYLDVTGNNYATHIIEHPTLPSVTINPSATRIGCIHTAAKALTLYALPSNTKGPHHHSSADLSSSLSTTPLLQSSSGLSTAVTSDAESKSSKTHNTNLSPSLTPAHTAIQVGIQPTPDKRKGKLPRKRGCLPKCSCWIL